MRRAAAASSTNHRLRRSVTDSELDRRKALPSIENDDDDDDNDDDDDDEENDNNEPETSARLSINLGRFELYDNDSDVVSNYLDYQHQDSISSLGKRRHDDSKIGRFRDGLGWFINTPHVQIFSMTLLLINAILYGVLTFDNLDDGLRRTLEGIDFGSLVFFSVEFLMQLVYLGFVPLAKNHAWLLADGVVLLLSWILYDLAGSIVLFRTFRILRLVLLVRRWKASRHLFVAVGRTLPKIATVWIILIWLLYIYCVLCTNLFHDLYEEGHLEHDYFGQLDFTFVTLFQILTLDSWTGIVREVMVVRPWAWILFTSFVVLTSFFVLNLFVAVVCESLLELRHVQEHQHMVDVIQSENDRAFAEMNQQLRESIVSSGGGSVDETMRLLRDQLTPIVQLQQTLLQQQQDMQKEMKEIRKTIQHLTNK